MKRMHCYVAKQFTTKFFIQFQIVFEIGYYIQYTNVQCKVGFQYVQKWYSIEFKNILFIISSDYIN